MEKFNRKYEDIITVENLFRAWEEFLSGKRKRNDVILFQLKLVNNIFNLQYELKNKSYQHGPYHSFNISDPKPRNIHKATVRDRLLHHLLYQELYPYFDRKFVYDSYSCRLGKGTHKAVYRLEKLCRKISLNDSRACWILKCDIKKFFANINHVILKTILAKHISDTDILWLLGRVIDSFYTKDKPGIGLPLGNLTSQLFINIYMNEFDQFVKRDLKAKNYIRYADDFIFLSHSRDHLLEIVPVITNFLENNLKLSIHKDKLFIKPIASGGDFLGWVSFPHHRLLRTTTKRRMFRRVYSHPEKETISSYKGLLKHGNTFKLYKKIKELENKKIPQP